MGKRGLYNLLITISQAADRQSLKVSKEPLQRLADQISAIREEAKKAAAAAAAAAVRKEKASSAPAPPAAETTRTTSDPITDPTSTIPSASSGKTYAEATKAEEELWVIGMKTQDGHAPLAE